jgi:hypothetical protein
LEQLRFEDFSKNLNTKFRVYRSETESFEAELSEVLRLNGNENLDSFSLVFLLPPEFGIEQRIYKIEHPLMETMELFIVPISRNEAGIRYEAIFNRIIKN